MTIVSPSPRRHGHRVGLGSTERIHRDTPERLPLSGEVVSAAWGDADPYLLKESIDLRTIFVTKQMGWFPETDPETGMPFRDGDHYDADPHTIHLTSRPTPESSLRASMRLTNVEAPEESLTFSMLANAPEMREAILRSEAFADLRRAGARRREGESGANEITDLWDLTRLVSSLETNPSEITQEWIEELNKTKNAMVELFGYGLGVTSPSRDQDPRWFFMTTEKVRAMLQLMGIDHEVVGQGRVTPTDEEDSFFCVVRPFPALDAILDGSAEASERERSAPRLRSGMAKAALHLSDIPRPQ